jgi:hypothetical protein
MAVNQEMVYDAIITSSSFNKVETNLHFLTNVAKTSN